MSLLFDPYDPGHLADPYPALARVRAATPALWLEPHRFFLVTRYADVVAASKRYEVFSSTGGVGPEWQPRPMMPMYDPPKHTRLRRMVAGFFRPNAIEACRASIRHVTSQAIERAFASPDQALDFVADLAEPIAITTLAVVLGIPPERRADLRRWADNTMADLAGGAIAAEGAAHLESTRKEFVRYLRELVAERQKSPGDDAISFLARPAEGEAISEKEVVAFCVLLLVAGFEPSASAIGNVGRALARHVGALDALGATPAALAASADELLRFDSSVHAFFRDTTTDTRIGDVVIPKDSKVMLHFAAANRDPAVFAAPDRLDLGRSPNPHIGFGIGPHVCLGMPLAKLQLTTLLSGLQEMVARVEELEPGVRHDNLLFHGMKRYRARLVPRGAR